MTLKPLIETLVSPAECRRIGESLWFVAFPRAAFGTLLIRLPSLTQTSTLTVHLGEKLDAHGRVDRDPLGSIRYRCISHMITPGQAECRIVIPPDERNTGPAAIRMPLSIGEVLPFRYVEIDASFAIDPMDVHQIAVHYPFDDHASEFICDHEVLNAVWELCKYSIKATTFCGVYVDGDRERIPYEGDAYINQLGHYGVDHEYAFARHSTAYMMTHPTWCTEWHLHSVMMAWMDYLYTGERDAIAPHYETLCAKTLIDFAREDGLISVDPALRTPAISERVEPYFDAGIIRRDIRDVVDWPPGSFTEGGTGERDNHEMCPINTVVNAFHAHTLRIMAQVAGALGKHLDQDRFSQQAEKVVGAINALLFDPSRGTYLDGEGSTHSSLHSNMFMLAFDLVPPERKRRVIDFVKSRGMACSVYGAQHLLDGLYLNGEGDYAMQLLTATHDRSWWNMLASGSTMTLEAWDWRYKNNLDWNHAWGAAPANIIPRYVLGVRPLTPGFNNILIAPQFGSLTRVRGSVPTPKGAVEIAFSRQSDKSVLEFTIPEGAVGCVQWPDMSTAIARLDGLNIVSTSRDGTLVIPEIPPGSHSLVLSPGGGRCQLSQCSQSLKYGLLIGGVSGYNPDRLNY